MMKFDIGDRVTLKNSINDANGSPIPAGTGGVVVARKFFSGQPTYTVNFDGHGKEIVLESDLN